MRILGIIPARFASTRFPEKTLVDIAGQTMIERVYRQVKKAHSLTKVIIATDHEKIEKHILGFGGDVMMTSPSHVSGTDRCFEVLSKQKEGFDYVINVQGDEPFIAPEQIELLASLLEGTTQLATLVKKINKEEDLFSPNVVKAVVSAHQEALYFSRSAIPHIRNTPQNEWLKKNSFFKHIGMYAYRTDVLKKISTLIPSTLEQAESLEQLRWLENGLKIKVAETTFDTIGIDTPEDLQHALAYLKSKG
jgi:3-deoxy-manno-octulosonate cytidylyltransferase (CMP-KDO synthetase)